DCGLHWFGCRGRRCAVGGPGGVAGVAAFPPSGRVRWVFPGGAGGGPAGDAGPPAAVWGGSARQLGRLGDAVAAGGDFRRDPGRGAVHAGPGGPLAAARQVGRGGPGHGVRAGPGGPGRRRSHRCAGRCGDRCRGLGRCLPAVCAQRGLPVAYRRDRSAPLDVGGRRGEAIRDALADQLGLTVVEVKPFGLSGSAGSTPLRIQVQDGADDTRYVFGKLYARSHLRADRSYKFDRALRYGRLEDEKPFSTVRRLVQQEDYALSLMQRAGLPSPQPYGVAELTPEREYLIVFEFLDGATELGEAGVDDAVIDQGLAIVRKLWDANLAHRDIKPANLLVRGGKRSTWPTCCSAWRCGPAHSRSTSGRCGAFRSARSTRRSPQPAGLRCPPSSAG